MGGVNHMNTDKMSSGKLQLELEQRIAALEYLHRRPENQLAHTSDHGDRIAALEDRAELTTNAFEQRISALETKGENRIATLVTELARHQDRIAALEEISKRLDSFRLRHADLINDLDERFGVIEYKIK